MELPKLGEIRKPTKTLAGVTPIAVVISPRKCKHGTCLYCPSLNVPQSYTPKSPAIMRASLLNYNPFKQVQARLQSYKAMNHPTDKIEFIIMGGTFLDYSIKYQHNFIKSCYDALNNKLSKNLEHAKKLNEKAKHRCVALCIETRPDVCSDKDVKRILKFGCTRVELGVQALDDNIYKKVKRGHKVKDVIEASKRLRNAGFKIGYHIMPGIPGSNIKKDIKMFRKLFSDENFKPDQLKIYPCQVIKGAELEKIYYKRKYSPYAEKELTKLLLKFLKLTPRYCRIMRIMREIPPDYLVAGIKRIDLRKDIEEELRKTTEFIKNASPIKEIRFREIGMRSRYKNIDNKNLKLKIIKYKASKGNEYFLEFINKQDILFGLLRLRISNNNAIIRELHVYGKSIEIGKKGKLASQHKGLGKKLLKEAEKIVKKVGIKKLKIISGVGVREYYSSKLNYHLDKEGIYMIKSL
ncbi:MAG TPA: tRNA uridine(34) 5-carboxymethylaminomethyl modification radical SAM/GNAT enzyme Elp3 [Candidatus Paceibacterota bacterium]|nr:tRNA uridine(34) 5-carboxymethylaminomethyl modification radical SAM/GNAT enzyme Elp3 [Candidatus Paceibacterota bacterium]